MSNIVTNLPTKFSRTELFPALCPPTTAICGRSKLQLWPMVLKASWSLLIRGIKSSIPRLPMVSDRLSARRNGLAAAGRSGYFQVFSFHRSNTSRSVRQRQITDQTLADGQTTRIRAHSLRSVLWSEDQSIIRKLTKQNFSLSSGQATSDLYRWRESRLLSTDVVKFDWSDRTLPGAFCLLIGSILVLSLSTDECYWTARVSVYFQWKDLNVGIQIIIQILIKYACIITARTPRIN